MTIRIGRINRTTNTAIKIPTVKNSTRHNGDIVTSTLLLITALSALKVVSSAVSTITVNKAPQPLTVPPIQKNTDPQIISVAIMANAKARSNFITSSIPEAGVV